MLQIGAVSVVVLAIFLKTEAFILPRGFFYDRNTPWANNLNDYISPRIDYDNDVRDLIFPGHIVYMGRSSVEQVPPNEKFLSDSDISDSIYEEMPLNKNQGAFLAKRTLNDLPTVSKRIHTCAFMRRLGLPIGLCFKGARSRVSQQPRVQEVEETPEQDAYAYLERQWPVHSMLGGGVGK